MLIVLYIVKYTLVWSQQYFLFLEFQHTIIQIHIIAIIG
jgi:hypothetical protein